MRKTAMLAVGALATIGTLGGAAAADAHSRAQTVRGHLVESSDWGWPTGYVSIDHDYDAQHHQIASDVTTCHASSPKATRATCQAAIAFRRGLVVVRFVESARPGPIHGRIVAGTGRYHGARGTITIVEGHNGDGPSTASWVLRIKQ